MIVWDAFTLNKVCKPLCGVFVCLRIPWSFSAFFIILAKLQKKLWISCLWNLGTWKHHVLFLSLQISGKEKRNILRQGLAKYDNLLLWIFHASVQIHLKLQQKLHYRNLVPSLKITSLIFWVNITYNAYCYSTISALALMLMLMFSVYLNNFPQHKKRSESISVCYVSLSDFSLPLNAQMHVPSPYVLVLRVWVGHPISSKREKEDLTRLYGNMNSNIIYPSVPHNHSVYVSGLKW